jgi:hypothetical protein
MTRDQLIETMALVLFNRMRTQRHMRPVDYIGGNNTSECNECRAVATAALTAIEAAGMRVVPVETVEHDPTNPFTPRERPKKSIRLMTDAERRAAGLDPNGGFDGPTGAD